MPGRFRLSIGGDPDGVERVNAAFGDFADAHAVPVGVRRGVNVALDELLTNTIWYGLSGNPGGGQGAGEVTVDVELHPDRLTVTLSDNGTPFDPTARSAPDTTLSVEDRPIGGQGIHLVRKLMDEVTYQRRADRNVVVLTKLLGDGTAVAQRRGEAMQISSRTQGDAKIVALAGKLDSVTSPEAQKALEAIVAEGGRKLAVDFSGLDYISSAGLRVLLGTAKQLRASGGGLRTFGMNETVREVFDISGFSTILPVFPSEADALNGF
jgi:anti-sigma B factor antagonist